MPLVVGLVVVAAVSAWWWWRSLAATARSVDAYAKTLRQLALTAQRGELGRRRTLPAMPKAHVKVWRPDVTPLKRPRGRPSKQRPVRSDRRAAS
ncbi:MAG: hypothetical protein JO148_13300 [Acidimicrobiia bacterium]|nr:hypothetical protein [Acidimicrobiia bacterium]